MSSDTNAKMTPNRLPCLDGLRAISILLVYVAHVQSTMPFKLPLWFQELFPRGELGVFIFFILSGFLITHLLQKEWQTTGHISLRNFYWRRGLRIFPAFYTYLIVLSILTAAGFLTIAWSHLGDAALFLWNYKHLWDPHLGQGLWFLGHFWTLSLEEQFYLLWPLMLLWLSFRRAAWLALALIFLMPVSRLVNYYLFPSCRGELTMMLHTGADALMFGCLLALWQGHPKMNKIMDRLAKPVWPILAALFAGVVCPLIADYLPHHLSGGYEAVVGRTLTGLCIAFMVGWLLRNPQCWAGRVLNTPVLVHFGVLSYSLYLWQQLFLTPNNKTWTGTFPFNLICAYAAAWLCYRLIEKPFLGLKTKVVREKSPLSANLG